MDFQKFMTPSASYLTLTRESSFYVILYVDVRRIFHTRKVRGSTES
jgi:hypothetical protein